MTAFALTICIFAMWSLIGWATVCALNGGRNLLRNALLSPIAGASVLVLAIFECNRWGASVQACGPVLTLLLGAIAAALIWRLRFPFPARRLMPFLAVLAAGALLIGYPMLLHGFNWLSFSNDDMANYVLGAEGFLKHGYLNSFDPRLIVETRDLGLVRWLDVIITGQRCGSELMLAWVMSFTGLAGPQIFMPVIVAFHLTLICAATALVVRGRNSRAAGITACAWITVSSLVTLGTVYQLIAQVFGLGLLAGAGAMLLEPTGQAPRRIAVRRALLASLFLATLAISYPEMLPFLVLAFGLIHALALWRRTETFASLARSTAFILAATILALNTFAGSVPIFLMHQADTGLQTAAQSDMLFPYYLLPSGLATFWGFLPIAQQMGRPLLDIAIVAGAILLASAVALAIWQAWLGQPAASIAVVMLSLVVPLARAQADFGLYKLAMYCQPFLLGSLALAFMGWQRKTSSSARWRIAAGALPMALLAGLGLPAEVHYVRLSAGLGGRGGGFVEIPEASSRHLLSRLQFLAHLPRRPLVVSDTANVVLAKMESAYLAPSKQQYPGDDFFSGPKSEDLVWNTWFANLVRPGYILHAGDALFQWHQVDQKKKFDMHGMPPDPFERVQGREGGEAVYSLLASGPLLSVVNRRQPSDPSDSMVSMLASEEVRNHLIQVDSDLGKNYYRSRGARITGHVALFQLEPDYFFPGSSMSGVGRMILFEVLHPSPGVRLQMEYTASLQTDGANLLPPAQAIGTRRSSLGAIGRGSARLFSAPLEPQTIAGRSYIAIDMGVEGRMFPQHRSGLMRWYGTSVPLDSRRITSFMRDVSAIDTEQYNHLQAPARVAHFPSDLACKDLEYSGIYEDGWVAEESFLRLQQPAHQMQLIVRAMVPPLGQKSTTLRLFVDGNQASQSELQPGDNEVRAIVEGPAGLRRIDLRFDGVAALPGADGRMVSAQLKFVGFSENSGAGDDIAAPPIAIGDHWYDFEKFSGQTFRWVENDARFAIMAPSRQSGELAIDFEPGPGAGGKPVVLQVVRPDGGKLVLPPATGRRTVRVPLALSAGVNDLSLRSNSAGVAIPSDPRHLNFRVFALTWTPHPGAR